MTGTCALIPAAGRGVRFGSAENKVFVPLLGRPLLGWTLHAFAQCAAIDQVVLIGGGDELPRLRAIGAEFGGGKVQDVVAGGADRQASVRAGLTACEAADFVVVHDAARPAVTAGLIERVLVAARRHDAATAALPVSDTLVQGGKEGLVGGSIGRDGLWRVQTPQAFRRGLLEEAHRRAEREERRGTDDAGLVRHDGSPVRLVPGSPENVKVTQPEDLALVEAILSSRQARPAPPDLRVGYGYDVHPFVEGRKLFLGGVPFADAPRGLLGHSDADVLLHALCDALLGAAGLGDIGLLFPDTASENENRPSLEFVREVGVRLGDRGWRISNIDITVLAEAPRIGPLAGEMKKRIAGALAIQPEQVGIKATTNEGMGFVGRGEGIAAHAVVMIFR